MRSPVLTHLVSLALAAATTVAGQDWSARQQALPLAPCPPPSMSRADLEALKRPEFVVPTAEERNRVAVLLLSCVDDPDPAVRDGIVFERLSRWLRGRELEDTTIQDLAERLTPALRASDDPTGFRRPFAALILSEVARADRMAPALTSAAREALVSTAAEYLVQLTDYRAFDPIYGSRHGVAHAADLVLQLGLNPLVSGGDVRRLLSSLAGKIAPQGTTFYSFGEPERLARAVLFIHQRGVLSDSYWSDWFASAANPEPFEDWAAAHRTLEGLAKRHNTIAFLHAVAFAGRMSGDDAGKKLATLADRETVRLMGG